MPSSDAPEEDRLLWLRVQTPAELQPLRKWLEDQKMYDNSRTVVQYELHYHLPVNSNIKSLTGINISKRLGRDFELDLVELPHQAYNLDVNTDLDKEDDVSLRIKIKIQKLRYSIYPPMVLINSPDCDLTLKECEELFKDGGANYFGRSGLTHLAINSPLSPGDIVRRPTSLKPLYGDFGKEADAGEDPFGSAFWCKCVQHGITQIWAPLHTMFSRGNIHEKMRILNDYQRIENTDIVDLYCGIGYFTLCYAKRGARRVFGWDLNPFSIEGLKRGAKANGVQDKIFAYLEDNAKCLERLSQVGDLYISHINMGLLPDCRKVWQLAVQLASDRSLNSSPTTTLHIHENVADKDIDSWCQETLTTLQKWHKKVTFDHVERIKTFAPGVYHICGDFTVVNAETNGQYQENQ